MKISFVESVPEIFEYPSETSLLDDSLSPTSNGSTVGHSVPSLGGKREFFVLWFVGSYLCMFRFISGELHTEGWNFNGRLSTWSDSRRASCDTQTCGCWEAGRAGYFERGRRADVVQCRNELGHTLLGTFRGFLMHFTRVFWWHVFFDVQVIWIHLYVAFSWLRCGLILWWVFLKHRCHFSFDVKIECETVCLTFLSSFL